MLIKCTECGKQVSDKAQACPYCGAPNEDQDSQVLNYMETRARFKLKVCRIMTIVGLFLLSLSFIAFMISEDAGWFFFCVCMCFEMPGIMGMFVHSKRLSHLEQSRRK